MNKLSENYKFYFVSAGSLTVNGNTPSVEIANGNYDDLTVILDISSVTGTNPTLDVNIQTSEDNSNWTTVDSFPQYTDADANTVKVKGININGPNSNGDQQRYVRLNFVVGGTTPDFGYSADLAIDSANAGADLNDNTAL